MIPLPFEVPPGIASNSPPPFPLTMTYPLMDTLNSAIFRISLVELTALEIRRLCSDVTVDMLRN